MTTNLPHQGARREVALPFSGFYESIHSDAIDREIQFAFEDDSGRYIHPDLYNVGDLHTDYRHAFLAYAAAYTDAFGSEYDIPSLEFQALESPQFYNFETDRIIATVSERDLHRIRSATDDDVLRRLARERHSHRPGFVSFYPSDVSNWGGFSTWDHNQIGTLLLAYCETLSGETWSVDAELALGEPLNANGVTADCVWSAMSAKAIRAANVARYLAARAARGAGYSQTADAFEAAW